MKLINRIYYISAFFLFTAWAVAAAQVAPDRRVPEFILEKRDSTLPRDSDMALARQLLARGAYISAAGLLEDIYSRNPENPGAVGLLLNCYLELKAYSKAEVLLKRQLEDNPYEYVYQERLLEVYLKMADDSLINPQINRILAIFPGNKDTYTAIIRKLTEYNRETEAMRLIDQGRREFGQNHLFALEAASILEVKGSYYDAVMEYFGAAQADTTIKEEVKRRLALLIRYPGAAPEVIKALKQITASLSDDIFGLRLLQEAYVKGNQFAEAFDVAIKIDSLTGGGGRELYQYMRQCRDRKLYSQVIEVAEYISRQYKRTDAIAEYRFYYSEALEGLGRDSEAIANYERIVQEFPLERDQAEALYRIGRIYGYKLHKFNEAARYFDSVVTSFRVEPSYSSAWYEIGRLHVISGQLDSAEVVFRTLARNARTPESKELLDYNLAMIQFYRDDFSAADSAFRLLIVTYPRGFYVNDALVNSLIIGESILSDPGGLSDYAAALYYENRLLPDSVISRFRDIIDSGSGPLSGLAMFKLAGVYASQGDTLEALKVIDSMEITHSEDYFYPYTLKLKGDIFFSNESKRKEATAVYKNILENYGDYPFTGEVRERLQELKQYSTTS
jgi:tetratricopeptide (TPR) repeat protein